jgi:RimJ/RimL family protein N-acetyltransferase
MLGKLVKLRGLENADVDALLRWHSDEEVTDFLGPFDYPVTRASEERYVALASTTDFQRAFIIETFDAVAIGECGLRGFNWKSRNCELFITIGDKTYWGKGYGADAVRILTRLAFDKLNLHRMWLTVLSTNRRAIRCYEKCGFVSEGVYKEGSYVAGRYVDVVTMGLIRPPAD